MHAGQDVPSLLHPELVKGFVAIGGYSVQKHHRHRRASAREASREDVVPVVLQHRAGPRRSGTQPERYRQIPLGDLGADMDLTDEAFNRSAPSFDNPDFVDIVIHSYRHRHRHALGEARFLDVERELAKRSPITVPSIVLRAGDSGLGVPSEDPSEDEAHFTNLVARCIVSGAGHDLPVQRPDAVSAALLELLSD